jgi:hypothetical protein
MKGDNKRTAILIMVIALAAVFWLAANVWMRSAGRFDNWSGMVITGVLLVMTAATMALGFILLARGMWIWSVIIGVLGTFLAVYGFKSLYLVGVAAAGLLWYWSAFHAARELTERRTIRISSILVHALPKILLGLYLLLSFAFYMTPDSHNISQADATKVFKQQLDNTYNSGLMTELEKLPPAQRTQVQAQVTSQAAKTFEQALNFQFCLGPDACTPTLLELLPPLYAFLFFLTIWGFGFIFRELAVATGIGLFTVLKGFHFVAIETEDIKAEVLRV